MIVALAQVPGSNGRQVPVFLLQVALLLLVAVCLGGLARRVGLPAVVGELCTGVLLGPSVFGRLVPGVSDWLLPVRPDRTRLLDALSQFAVLMLVGVAGAHLDLRMIRRRTGVVVRISVAGLVIPLSLGVGSGYLLPPRLLGAGTERSAFALFLGVALGVSAIPVIAKTLVDMNLMHRDIGQLSLAAASLQDASAWFLLSLVSTMAVTRLDPARLAVSALALIGFVLVAAYAGRAMVGRAMRLAGRAEEPGPVIATAVVIVLLFAAASQALGMEAVFGAFVAGVLLASVRTGQALLAPLRTVTMSVFAPVFLASAGLRIDLGALADPAVLLSGLAILALAMVGKFVGGYVGARLSRLGRWEGLAIGAALNARGVVEVVVGSVGLQLGVLTVQAYTIIILVAVVTSVTAPPLLRWAMARVEQTAEERLRESEHGGWAGRALPAEVAATTPDHAP